MRSHTIAAKKTVAGWVDERFPEPPDTVDTLRGLVGDDQFGRVFTDVFEPAPDIGPPPTSTNLSNAVVESVVPSTVKVEGVACDRIQEGSGFVVGPGGVPLASVVDQPAFTWVLGTDVSIGPVQVPRAVDLRQDGRIAVHVWAPRAVVTVTDTPREP